MRKIHLILLSTLLVRFVVAQEVFLLDLNSDLSLSNPINVSENPGSYDSQPSFLNDSVLLFSSTRNGQTDICWYNILNNTKKWISTTQGSEYSPLKIPGSPAISSIRLDTTGLQRLYKYDYQGKYEVLIQDLIIGYHVWIDKNTLVSFVLGDESSLVVSNLAKKENITYDKKIGRSLHKVPGTNLVSYISKAKETWEIKTLNPKTGATKLIIETLKGSEDMTWTSSGTILMGNENTLYKYHPEIDNNWVPLQSFEMKGITRLAVSPKGEKIAIVFKNGQ